MSGPKRGTDGKFVPSNPADDDDVVGEEPVVEASAEERAPIDITDIVGGDFQAPAEGVVPDATIPASEPVVDAGVTDEADYRPKVVQLDDGTFQLGKFKAATVEDLAAEIDRARYHVEKKVGAAPKDDEAPAVPTNPWLTPDGTDGGDFDDDDVIDGGDFAQSISQGVIQNLAQLGLLGQQNEARVDPMQAAIASLEGADKVLADPNADDSSFRHALAAVLTHAPQAVEAREKLLEAWGQTNPYQAGRVGAQIEFREAQLQQQAVLDQQQAQAHAAATAEQEGWQAYQDAETGFFNAYPQAAQLRGHIDQWFARPENQQVAAGARGNRAAMHRVFEIALADVSQAAAAASTAVAPLAGQHVIPQGLAAPVVAGQQFQQLAPGVTLPAGYAAPVSEHGGIMQGMGGIDPNAVYRAQQAQQRELAGLETGSAVDGIQVNLTNPHSPEATGQSFRELLGVGVVGE